MNPITQDPAAAEILTSIADRTDAAKTLSIAFLMGNLFAKRAGKDAAIAEIVVQENLATPFPAPPSTAAFPVSPEEFPAFPASS